MQVLIDTAEQNHLVSEWECSPATERELCQGSVALRNLDSIRLPHKSYLLLQHPIACL